MFPSLDPANLHAEASAATGLHDFGESSYREALERLTDALNTEARPRTGGRPTNPVSPP